MRRVVDEASDGKNGRKRTCAGRRAFCRCSPGAALHSIPGATAVLLILINLFVLAAGVVSVHAQQTYSSPNISQFTSGTSRTASPGSYLKNSAAFRQEIMRMEINVTRGSRTLPITQVPRVQKDDVIRMRLLDESTGGVKPSESYYNWTFLVAFVNPHRKSTTEGKASSVSQEIQFRKSGWYKEYAFVVPYDSQPIFFLYPKPKYRAQILKLVNRKYEEVRRLGDKTIELADAYSRIDSFLTELQSVFARTQSSLYGGFVTYPQAPAGTTTTSNPYGASSVYNPYGTSSVYNPFGTTTTTTGGTVKVPDPLYNYNAFFEQTVERLAAGFNINLPSCWQTANGGYNYFGTGNSGSSYGSGYGGSTYGSSYGTGYGTAGNGINSFGHAVSSEFVGRAQCVARNLRIEDFDFSVAKLLQEGGIFALTQLRDKYPQFAYYINLAAVAIDFIVKVFQKYPLKIVPTIIQTSDNNGYGNPSSGSGGGSGGNNSLSSSSLYSSSPSSSFSAGQGGGTGNAANATPVKISLFAEAQPSDSDSVTAYPVVVHKWQSDPDPEVITLAPPVLVDPCLHAGQNILKSTDLGEDETADNFTRDLKISISSPDGFRKEFPVRKNPGAGGWELNLTNEDLNSFPKIQMILEAELTGTRGFNEIKSPKFILPINTGNSWQVKQEAQKAFSVGGKRIVTLQNTTGTCRCLQAVIYKPSFGGQFVFEANAKTPANQLQYSLDGREVSFEVDATNFQPGAGTLELKTYGDNQPVNQMPNQANNQSQNTLPIKLYPYPPEISDFRVAGGDRQAIITGSRLEQLQWVRVNGKRMKVVGNIPANQNNQNSQPNNQVSNGGGQPISQPNFPNSQISASSVINQNPNERTLVFEDGSAKQEGGIVTLELGLDDDRSFAYPVQFKVKPARPTIIAEAGNEVEGMIVNDGSSSNNINNSSPANENIVDGNMANSLNQNIVGKTPVKTNAKIKTTETHRSSFTLHPSEIFPAQTKEIAVDVRNALTDYDFRPEYLTVETRIENSGIVPNELPKTSFEVYDWKSLKLKITLNDQITKIIGGRRLQFRLKDRERGDSDWYTIKQTFVRIPEIREVSCTTEMNGQCQIKGDGIEYIGQVSTDGGKTWSPNENSTLQIQQTADGQSAAMIPLLPNKKLLQINLRDFPKMDGINVMDFTFSNSVRITRKNNLSIKTVQVLNQSVNPAQSNRPDSILAPNSLPVQNGSAVQNQPGKSAKPKPKTRSRTKS